MWLSLPDRLRVTDETLVIEIAYYGPSSICLRNSILYLYQNPFFQFVVLSFSRQVPFVHFDDVCVETIQSALYSMSSTRDSLRNRTIEDFP